MNILVKYDKELNTFDATQIGLKKDTDIPLLIRILAVLNSGYFGDEDNVAEAEELGRRLIITLRRGYAENPFFHEMIDQIYEADEKPDFDVIKYWETIIQSYKGSEVLIDLMSIFIDNFNCNYSLEGATNPGWTTTKGKYGKVLTVTLSDMVFTNIGLFDGIFRNLLASLLWFTELHVNYVNCTSKISANIVNKRTRPVEDRFTYYDSEITI